MASLFSMSRRSAIPLTGLALLLTAATADASTVSRDSAGTLQITAAPGQQNVFSVNLEDDGTGRWRVRDNAGLEGETPSDCERPDWDDTQTTLICAPSVIVADLGDANDQSTVWDGLSGISVFGGPGDDWLTGGDGNDAIDGGPGSDRIRGNKGDDLLRGGDDNDDVEGGAGSDVVDAGSGDDLLSGDGYEGQWPDVIDGGPGTDRIEADWADRSYDAVQPPVAIGVDDGPGDGRPGEGDDVRGVETIIVNIPGSYRGTAGADTIRVRQVLGSVALDGRGGDDTLAAADGADTLDGGAGNDNLDGGFGDDIIVPGPGRDTVSADTRGGDCGPLWCKYPFGNDTVFAADGEVDSISCGAGTDRVVADAIDVVASDCEQVERSSAPLPGGGGAAADPAPAGARLAVTRSRLARALSAGLRVRVSGVKAKRKLTLTAKRGRTVVARGTARASKKGTATVRLRFTRKGRSLLRGRHKVTLKITGAGAATTVTLRR